MSTTFVSGPIPAAPPWSRRRRRPSGSDPSRLVGIVVVVVAHVALAYALVDVLAQRTVSIGPQALQTHVLHEAQKPDATVKPPPPKLDVAPPPAFVPPVEVNITTAAVTSNAIAAVAPTRPVAAPAPAPAAPVHVQPTLDLEHSVDPTYPPISRRMGEEGIVTLLVLVGPDGSVEEVRLEKTSGYTRLDQAAMDGARTHCRFKPGSVDGKPAALWYRYRYQFRLT